MEALLPGASIGCPGIERRPLISRTGKGRLKTCSRPQAIFAQKQPLDDEMHALQHEGSGAAFFWIGPRSAVRSLYTAPPDTISPHQARPGGCTYLRFNQILLHVLRTTRVALRSAKISSSESESQSHALQNVCALRGLPADAALNQRSLTALGDPKFGHSRRQDACGNPIRASMFWRLIWARRNGGPCM